MSAKAREIKLFPLQVHSQAPSVSNLPAAIEQAMAKLIESDRFQSLPSGASIAVTAGSRGIANYVEIMRHTVRFLREKGFKPFLISAMGSHGRGEAEGQKEVLDSLGITEDAIGCPVLCSSEVQLIDEFEAFGRSIPVYCAKEAMEADGVVVVNRVKPHTSFRGEYESGLLKMMTVGMGRAKGADMFHSLGADYLAPMIPLIGGRILEQAPILGGIGIVENDKEQTAIIEGIPYHQIFAREKVLLEKAKQFMPRLPVDRADLCIVREMGKNYSGTGMDTNIIGRMRIQGVKEPEKPFFTYIGVLRLSEPSHGNATGIGLADLTTEALVKKIDKTATYLNCVTSGFVIRAAIPMTFPTDETLVDGALKMLRIDDASKLRMVAIRNTLHIDHLWVTEAIYEEIKDQPHIQLTGEPRPLQFDDEGNWIWDEP
jgi:hypothetical protein